MRPERPNSAPRLTCETTLASVPSIRAFWATLLEDIGQPYTLVPTVADEVLRRERLNATHEWERRLKWLNREHPQASWGRTDIRCLATLAGATARDHLRKQMQIREGPYHIDQASHRERQDVVELESRISDVMDDRMFDQESKNWLADREIVIQAMARGYDILATNNVRTITHSIFRHWIAKGEGASLGLSTSIMEPPQAEEALRLGHDKPLEWAGHMAMRACVTNPDDELSAFVEIARFTKDFGERGMLPVANLIQKVLDSKDTLQAGLDQLRRRGLSSAGRYEAAKAAAVTGGISKQTGLPAADVAASSKALSPSF